MAGTDLTYNGVVMKNVRTVRFSQNVVYDESNTDVLHHEFVVRVEGIVHLGDASTLGVSPTTSNVSSTADALQSLQGELMHPRGEFLYTIGGETALVANSNPRSRDRDVKNGPRPISLNLTHITDNVVRVEYEIEVNVIRCIGIARVTSEATVKIIAGTNARVLNNRWSLTDELTETLAWSRTWEGILRVDNINTNPQAMRAFVTPPLQKGYKRKRMRFQTTPNGLTLRYSVQDVQEHAAPPFPATDWDATYTETSSSSGGSMHAEVAVRLTGPPHVDKKELIVRCAQVVRARLGTLGTGEGQFMTNSTIIDRLSSPDVEMRVRIIRTSKDRSKIYTLLKKQLGEPLSLKDYDSKLFAIPFMYDRTSPTAVWAMYLQNPCGGPHGVSQATTLSAENSPDSDDTEVEFFESPGDNVIPLDPLDKMSDEQRGGNPYTLVEIENNYSCTTGNYALPFSCSTSLAGGATVALVKLHEGAAERELTMRAERVGDWPDIPATTGVLTDPNGIPETLLDYNILPSSPELMPDNTSFKYKAEVRYRYALSRPPTAVEVLRAGSSPVDESESNVVPASVQSTKIQ